MKRTARTLTLLALLVLPSCTILAPQPDASRFYLLTPSAATGAPPAGSRGLVIGLGPTKLPDYLLRSEIATRVSPNRVAYADDHRWAEPLERNFNRVLAEVEAVDSQETITVALQCQLPLDVGLDQVALVIADMDLLAFLEMVLEAVVLDHHMDRPLGGLEGQQEVDAPIWMHIRGVELTQILTHRELGQNLDFFGVHLHERSVL